MLQHLTHQHCYACGKPEAGGLGLCFVSQSDGSVTADWACPTNFQSFEGILHGGIIATLLDGAMVHALFADGVVAQTAELCVRYRHPIKVGSSVRVTARRGDRTGPLHLLSAEISQNEVVSATAHAKFMAVPLVSTAQLHETPQR